MLLSLLALSASTQSVISLSLPAQRLPMVLESVSQKIGKKLSVAGALRDVVLLVEVKDVNETELMDRLATASRGSWSTLQDGTLHLSRSSRTSEEMRRASVDARLEDLQAAIERFKKVSVGHAPEFTENDASMLLKSLEDANSRGPITDVGQLELRRSLHDRLVGGRLLSRLMSKVDLRSVASMPLGERLVFSTEPTKEQRAFSDSIESELAQFKTEQNSLAVALKGFSASPIIASEVGALDDRYYRQPMKSPPVRVMISVFDRGKRWDLRMFSESGSPIFGSSKMLFSTRTLESGIDPSLFSVSPRRFLFSSEGKSFRAATAGLSETGVRKFVPAEGELLGKLHRPEEFDPLSFAATESVRQIVAATSTNFVGALPDEMLTGGNQIGQVAAALKMRVVGGWLECGSTTPEMEASRIPRGILRALVVEASASRAYTMRAKAILIRAGIPATIHSGDRRSITADAYGQATGCPAFKGQGDPLATLVVAETERRLTDSESSTFGLDELPPSIVQEAHAMLLRNAEVKMPVRAGEAFGALASEPTVALANGFPPGAKIRIDRESTMLAINWSSPGRDVLSPADLRSELSVRTPPPAGTKRYSKEDLLLPMLRSRYSVTITVGTWLWSAIVSGESVPSGAVPRTLQDTPADLRKAMGIDIIH